MATTIYDYNFGFWDIDGQVEQAFFEYIQRARASRKLVIAASAPLAAHAAQGDLRLLRLRARMRRTHDDEQISARRAANRLGPMSANLRFTPRG